MSDGEGEKKKEKDETEEVKKVEMPMELGMLLPKKVGRWVRVLPQCNSKRSASSAWCRSEV